MKGWFYLSDRRRCKLWKVRFPYDGYDRCNSWTFFLAIAAIRASVAIVAIIWKPGFKLPVSLRQVADILYQSITKLPMPLRRPLGIWFFLEGFGQIPRYVGSLDGQIPHRLALEKVSNKPFPPKHNRNISSLGKLSHGDLFIPIALFISKSPHLTGSFKLRVNGRNIGSCWPTMLLQQCCVRLHVAS